MLRINKESLFQDLAARAASVEVVKIGADWRCEAYDSRGNYIGGSSAGGGPSSLARMQEDAYEIARFITQPIAPDGDALIRLHCGFDPNMEENL